MNQHNDKSEIESFLKPMCAELNRLLAADEVSLFPSGLNKAVRTLSAALASLDSFETASSALAIVVKETNERSDVWFINAVETLRYQEREITAPLYALRYELSLLLSKAGDGLAVEQDIEPIFRRIHLAAENLAEAHLNGEYPKLSKQTHHISDLILPCYGRFAEMAYSRNFGIDQYYENIREFLASVDFVILKVAPEAAAIEEQINTFQRALKKTLADLASKESDT